MGEQPDFREWNKQVITQFRGSGGQGELGPIHFDRLVLLTTTGRVSGRPHTAPLGSVRSDDGGWILFGANMGAPVDPDWVKNLRADPQVHVEVTGDSFDAEAVELTGEARGAAYQRWVDSAPNTAGYQERAGREIPMILVTRSP